MLNQNTPITFEDRLKAKIAIAPMTGCWEFTGYRLPNGYGRIAWKGKTSLAHRASWENRNGDIPSGLVICHRCDNPPCVNPDHLFLGTYSDNARDKIVKRRDRHPSRIPKKQGEGHPLARLTADQVREIRSRASEPRKVLAAEFGLSLRYTSSLICGKRWMHLEAPEYEGRLRGAKLLKPGMRFNKLTVIESGHIAHDRPGYLCACDCGHQCIVRGTMLRTNRTKSCGCLRGEVTTRNNKLRSHTEVSHAS